jgi:hypothetical protein
MHMLEDGSRHRVGEPGQGQKLVERGRPQGLQGAVLLQQAGPASGAQSGDALQGALGHALAPELPVVGDGEPVGLVAYPLEEKEGF